MSKITVQISIKWDFFKLQRMERGVWHTWCRWSLQLQLPLGSSAVSHWPARKTHIARCHSLPARKLRSGRPTSDQHARKGTPSLCIFNIKQHILSILHILAFSGSTQLLGLKTEECPINKHTFPCQIPSVCVNLVGFGKRILDHALFITWELHDWLAYQMICNKFVVMGLLALCGKLGWTLPRNLQGCFSLSDELGT